MPVCVKIPKGSNLPPRVWAKEAERQMIQQSKQRAKDLHTGKNCPFNDPMNGLHPCKKDCALYGADGCAMKRRDAAQDTWGSWSSWSDRRVTATDTRKVQTRTENIS